MVKYSNNHKIPLSVAVWLAHDSYDHVSDPDYFSSTTILRPIKQVILGKRVEMEMTEDISTLIPSRLGSAIHDAIETAWLTKAHIALKNLGYPQEMIDRVIINPTKEEIALSNVRDPIWVFMEKRTVKELMGIKIGGKFDMVIDGGLEDHKSTKTFSYTSDSNADDYIIQGSIYRWLNPDIITKDYLSINYIFTDWLRSQAQRDPNYPQSQVIQKQYPLMSLEDTEEYLKNRINLIRENRTHNEEYLPRCTDDDLWRTPPKYKYYKNPANAEKPNGRSTKNFDTMAEALIRQQEDGNTGIIVTVKGQIKRCNYCPGFAICKQKDEYLLDGTLIPII